MSYLFLGEEYYTHFFLSNSKSRLDLSFYPNPTPNHVLKLENTEVPNLSLCESAIKSSRTPILKIIQGQI